MISQYTNIIFLISSFQEHFHVHHFSSDSKGLKLKSMDGPWHDKRSSPGPGNLDRSNKYFGSLKQTNYS